MERARKLLRQGVVTSAKTQIDNAKSVLAKEQVTVEQIKVALKQLNDYRDKLADINPQFIADITDEDEAITESINATKLDSELLEAISTLSARIETLQNSQACSEVKFQSMGSLVEQKIPSVKLPKLEIEKFSGDSMKWAEFWDSYNSTIHTNEDLSDVDKFKYLRRFLSDDALGVIDGYSLTNANYSTAVEALCERFGNKQLAIFAHFEAMLGLPVASYGIKQLHQTYDACEKHIRSLVALGLAEETFAQVFIPIILSKLPPYIKTEMYRKNSSDPWELAQLRTWVREEIRARDYSQRVFANSSSANQEYSGDKYGKRHGGSSNNHGAKTSGTSAALVASETKSSPRCSFCGEGHFADQCPKYTTIVDRKQRILEERRCFRCLSSKHIAKNCEEDRKCVHCKKSGHHRSLCKVKFGSHSDSTGTTTALTVDNSVAEPHVSKEDQLIAVGERAILQTAVAKIKTPGGSSVTARILFDTGCTRSFVTTKLSKAVKSHAQPDEVVAIAGFSDSVRKTMKYKTIEFDIILSNGKAKTITANVTPTISCPIQKFPLNVGQHPLISQLQLADPPAMSPEMVTIDILVGTDYYYEFVGSEQIRLSSGLVFLSSSLGYIATGKVKSSSSVSEKRSALFVNRTEAFPESTFHVDKFWSLEDIGIKETVDRNDDDDAIESFKKSIEFKNGRYHVAWPWKKDVKELPDNYHLALGRLKSLRKKLDGTPEVLTQYDKTIQDQLDKGIIEEVPTEGTMNKIHYIPHHCVLTPNKATTKLRVVYDASAKVSKQSNSINECLNRGPVLLDNLCGLLLRFRLHGIGIVSDIEKAFLQVGLHDEARDVTRFLWFRDLQKGVHPENLVEYRFTRVPFGYNSSPFLLSATVDHHVDNSDSPVAPDIKGNKYVDNVLISKGTFGEAVLYYKESKELFNKASMNLREWYTNSKKLRELFASSDRGKDEITKVLGLVWNTTTDTLSTSSFRIQKESVTTKRQMLSSLAKVFDPCGYFAPITVTGKVMMQTLWKDNYGWDDNLPSSLIHEWNECATELMRIAEFQIPRFDFKQEITPKSKLSLHCFTDASAKAYGACIYLVKEDESTTESTLVFAKSRVAPLKSATIPRLELLGVLIGVRLLSFVIKELQLPISSKTLWSDSQCVLHWLRKASVETRFVKNRITEIASHKDVSFRYVPSADNPADVLSRGCSYSHLDQSKVWWHGPHWLTKSSSHWPKNIVPEVSPEPAEDSNIVMTANELPADDVVDVERFSSLSRLVRVTAWVSRFIRNMKSVCQKESPTKGHLQSHELASALKYWEKLTQQQHFSDVTVELKNKVRGRRADQLNAFQDNDGLLRRGGRLEKADIPQDAKFPVLLPRHNKFTNLVIDDCHKKLFHAGVSHTLANTRLKYWIVQGRCQVKKVISKCRMCRLLYGGPFSYPKAPALPKFRVNSARPFENVGIDYMGPLQVKQTKHSTGEPVKKVWICLFTCAAIRAVHLEVVTDLSARQFLQCLRRFVALYGKPSLIVSDNGKQFKASERFLTKSLQSQEVQDFAASRGITWKFITERPPWMGGFYERLVGIVKRSLKTSLDRRCVNLTELQTVAVEVASIVNSRPITYSDCDSVPLTPSHFLGGPCFKVSSFADTNGNSMEPISTYASIIRIWKRMQAVTNSFWRTWRHQYLLSLRQNVSFRDRNSSPFQPKVGSVVLIKDDLPRSCWRLGKIMVLEQCQDGKIRTAQVELSNRRRINRAIRHLYPIEVPPEPDSKYQTQPVTDESGEDDGASIVSTQY